MPVSPVASRNALAVSLLASLLAGLGGSADAATAPATSPDQVAPAPDSGEGAEVLVVTGVRGQPRTVVDSPAPIDVIGAVELAHTGRVGLKDILGNIIPSLDVPALGGGGTSASVKPFAIRGLSGDYALVLVNGKRRHTTSLINNLSNISGGSTPVDIDLIPTNAISRIEVLRDGAAAQYGSDAIAGVINLILDSSAKGGNLELTTGKTYEHEAALAQADLSFGTKLGDGGFIHFAEDAKYHDHATSSAQPVPYIFPFVNGQPDPRESTANHLIAGGYGRSNRDEISNSSYNAELPISAATRLYSFSTLSYRNIKDARGAVASATTGYGGATNALGDTVLPQVFPGGSLQAYRRIREWDFQATLGVKSTIAGWSFDLSSSYGNDSVKLGAEGTINPSLGPTSPTSFVMGHQKQTLWINNLDITREFNLGLAKPVAVALGAEQRWEKFQNIAGEPDSYINGGYIIPVDATPFGQAYGGKAPSPGLISFTGTSPADARSISRGNVAAYIDISTDILPGWYLGAAGRYEQYTDSAGATYSGKISTRIEIAPGLALRGGINNGFRAPSLAQTAFSTTQNTSQIVGGVVNSITSKFLPVDSPAAIALGATPLKPEKSLNFTGGVAFEHGAFRLTVDGYQIRINDRILKTDQFGGAGVVAILAANGISHITNAQYFANAANTRTRGVDVVSEYTVRSGNLGTVKLSAAWSNAQTTILRLAPTPGVLDGLGLTLFGRQTQLFLTEALPRSKVVASGTWSLGRAHALLRLTRFGQYVEPSTVAARDALFGAKVVTDLDLGYQLTSSVDVSVGANNLFDVYPDKNGIIAYDGSGQYGAFAPFGLSGGFYYARIGWKF